MAVKCILTGQDKIFVEGLLKGDGNGNITAADETEVELVDLPQEIFWATYGTTTSAEIEGAYQSGKIIYVKRNSLIYTLGQRINENYYTFYCINNVNMYYQCICSNNQWSQGAPYALDYPKRISLSLPAASWTGSDPYTQTVIISGSNAAYTKVDIQPSEEIYDQLVTDNVGYLAIKNVNGTLTAVAKGGKPSADLNIQVTYYDAYVQ